jgi:hypothetical protein
MDKKMIFKGIVGLIIVGVMAYLYLTGGKLQMTGSGFSISKTITNKSETFIGDLKAAIDKGTPFKCTFKNPDGSSGTGYMKNRNYYGEITMQGKAGYILMLNNCMWTWDKVSKQGAKMCFTGDIWDTAGQTGSTSSAPKGEYTCTSGSVDDKLFTVPADVNFIDADSFSAGE